jgi:hypothetical protein
MQRLALMLLAFCLSLPAMAEQKQTYGALEVHYSAFNSGFLQPEVAAAVGLVRSKRQGVVNVALLQAGKASTGVVTGEVRNLLGQITPLSFKQVKEGTAIYYLAQFPFDQQEMLRFTLNIKGADGVPHSFDFNQEFFPEQ